MENEEKTIHEWVELESIERGIYAPAYQRYRRVADAMEKAIGDLVTEFYSLFHPILQRALKHKMDIPEIKKGELDDCDYADWITDVCGLCWLESKNGFELFYGTAERDDSSGYSYTDDFNISIPSKYVEKGGLDLMRKEAADYVVKLDALDAAVEYKKHVEQDAKDRATFERLRAKFADNPKVGTSTKPHTT